MARISAAFASPDGVAQRATLPTRRPSSELPTGDSTDTNRIAGSASAG